jgi:hypothetical protein
MFGRRFARRFFGGPGRGPWGGPGPWGEGPWGGPGPQGPWGGPGPQGPWREGHHHWFSPEQAAMRSTAGEVARLFMIASRSSAGNPERQAKLRGFLERSRKELSDIIYESGGSTGPEQPPSGTTQA